MGIDERLAIYNEIEAQRGHPLIVYYTSPRTGAPGIMAGDVIPEFIDQLEKLPEGTDELDILIESSGGDPLVPWRLMSLLRERINKISVLVPYSAFSAATLLALGCNEILMGKYGCLGPIDPQMEVTRKDGRRDQFAYQDIVSYLDFVSEEAGLTEQMHTESAFKILCEQVEPSILGKSRRASSLSVTMAEMLLQTHMTSAESKIQASSIARKLNESYFSHGHAVGRSEAKDIGLNVIDANNDLENFMWLIHKDIEDDLSTRKPFHPVEVFLSKPEASIYLKSPPPLNIPSVVPQQVALQMIQQYINDQLKANVPDVTVELVHALLESPRYTSSFEIKSKILLSRTPDLRFNASMVQLEGFWKHREIN